MIRDKVDITNIKNITSLSVEFVFPESGIIVVTGKNGAGKTSIVKAFNLANDPKIFEKSAGLRAINAGSEVSLMIEGFDPFVFRYNEKLRALDTKSELPDKNSVIAELPIPYGRRFGHFSLIANYDRRIRENIAATEYEGAFELIEFLSEVYASEKFTGLKSTNVNKHTFYFLIKEEDYYIREDHLSSGEFFLIQLFRLIVSGAKLVIIDELDVALDSVAQVRLYSALKPILKKYKTRLIVISHSLAFMSTVDDGGLYYLEEDVGKGVTLEQRSFGYIKSDLYGFSGYDRYILTEDSVLEGFIEYLVKFFSVDPFYQHCTIGVAGINQLQKIVEKNDKDEIFAHHSNVICIVDGDGYQKILGDYRGCTKIHCSPVDDIERYIFRNRESLLPDVELPGYKESETVKKASKAYWKYLTVDKDIKINQLYKLVVDHEQESAMRLANAIKAFLTVDE